jgi:hypothetical protein
MDSTSIDAKTGERLIEVPSFTDPHKTYSVDLEIASCDCPRYVHRGNCVKHVIAAEAMLKARSRKLPIEREIAERVVLALCKRIFNPKRESASDAYGLMCEVIGSRYSTARMVEAARRRHRRARIVELGRIA